jgi:hypothetical protein
MRDLDCNFELISVSGAATQPFKLRKDIPEFDKRPNFARLLSK